MNHKDDYPAAAGKHLADAKVLLADSRYDGAAYLAGYAAECAIKTLIKAEICNAPRSHDLGSMRESLGVLAVHADTRTSRSFTLLAATLTEDGIQSWRPQMRYRACEVTHEKARAWLDEAASAYALVIGGLTLDGEI